MIHKQKNIAAFLFFLLPIIGLVFLNRSSVDSSSDSTDLTGEDIYLPLVSQKLLARLESSPFGVQTYGSTESDTKYFSDLYGSRASWIRNMVHWSDIEPENTTPDKFKWGYTDNILAAARSSVGFNMIANIENSPAWAATRKKGVIDLVSLDEYAEFVGALAERYDGDGYKDAPGSPKINYWEFYNEPDRYNNWGDYPKEYADMLAAVYPALKGANPEAKVVFGGIAHDWFVEDNGQFVREFLDGVLENGGGKYFDIMNIHAYPVFNLVWAESGPGLIEKVESVRKTLRKYNYGSKPMIITEAGWHSDDQPNWPSDQRLQSEYLVKLYTQSIAADIKVMIWWMFYDSGDHNFDNGLVTNSDPPQRKESFYTYRRTASKLESANFIRFRRSSTIASGETFNIDSYLFEISNGQQFYITWRDPVRTHNDSGRAVFQKLAHKKVTLRDITTDSVISVINDGDDGSVDGFVTFVTTARPVYVEVNQ